MSKELDSTPRVAFVQFAEVAGGVRVSASSDRGVRQMKPQLYSDYNAACQYIAGRLGKRPNPPPALYCELVH